MDKIDKYIEMFVSEIEDLYYRIDRGGPNLSLEDVEFYEREIATATGFLRLLHAVREDIETGRQVSP